MTTFGGANSAGTIFKIKPDGTGYADLFDFVGGFSTGINPWGSLISDGTYLYGMTRNFGASGDGTIFRIKTDGTGYSDLYAFDMTNGGFPQGSLISIGSDLYGMTYNGGTSSDGTVFKFHSTSGTGISRTGNTMGQLSVYPNPTNGKITIANSGMPVAIAKLEIYNAMGEAIYTGTDLNIVKSKEIDLSDFPRGTYFLKIVDGTSVHTRTIVLQ
jgi:uncharacterized repeat protein (TIGR03803 family)